MGRSPYSAGGDYHVFLSFSGVQSRRAAQVLANWIDELLPPVRVFLYGPESAAIGSDWMDHVYDSLRDADALVSFVTRDNIDKYWIKEELEAAVHSTRCRMIMLILLDGLQAGDLPPGPAVTASEAVVNGLPKEPPDPLREGGTREGHRSDREGARPRCPRPGL